METPIKPLMVHESHSPRSQAAARRRAARRQRTKPVLGQAPHPLRLPSMSLALKPDGSPLESARSSGAGSSNQDEELFSSNQQKLLALVGEGLDGIVTEMSEGMYDLLELHNSQELSSLCGALGLRLDGTAEDMAHEIETWLTTEARYSTALRFMWEGTLLEYLRINGMAVRHAKAEPRKLIMKYWRRAKEAPQAMWLPLYVPRTQRPKAMDVGRDERIVSFLRSLREHEYTAKRVEHSIRTDWNFQTMLNFFAAMAALRAVEKDGREFLLDKLETTVARLHHTKENLEVTTLQLRELEERYLFITKRDVHVGAAQLALDDQLFSDYFVADAERRMMEEWAVSEMGDLNGELAATQAELRKTAQERQEALETLADTQRQLAEQTARADGLQEDLASVTGKFDDLCERYVTDGAVEETEREYFFSLGTTAEADIAEREARVETLNPMLMGMLESDLDREVDQARQIIETLQVLNRELLVEHEELVWMRRHELQQRVQEGVEMALKMVEVREKRRNALVPDRLPDMKRRGGKGKGGGKKKKGGGGGKKSPKGKKAKK